MKNLEFRPLDTLNEDVAKRMFAWESDPDYASFCVVCKDPSAPPRYASWQDLQQSVNRSGATRFGIYVNKEFVGEFNFVFDHPALLKSNPKTAWIGIGIGPRRFRGLGLGIKSLEFLEKEIKQRGGQRIELGVFEFNRPAISLYTKMGYHHFHTIPEFTCFQGKFWADLRFEKFL